LKKGNASLFRELHGMAKYTAVIQNRSPWWIGWVEEVPGVNSQGATREELLENLQSALQEALEMNRTQSVAADQLTRPNV
jgi:predicted RNase H-like HicB family nuclease